MPVATNNKSKSTGFVDFITSLFNKGRKETIQTGQNETLDTQFASAIALLESENSATRIVGAGELYLLANEQPGKYRNPVCEAFCTQIRTITGDRDYQDRYMEHPSKEIETLLGFLFKKTSDKASVFDACKKNLRETFLQGANFFNAKLSDIDFRKTILNNVNFFGAALREVDFSEAKLNDINFSSASLYKVNFWDAKLLDINFFYAEIKESKFWDARLNKLKFSEATLSDVNFEYAKLNRVDFHGAKLSRIDFSDAYLEKDINFDRTLLEHYSYEEIRRAGCSFEVTKA